MERLIFRYQISIKQSFKYFNNYSMSHLSKKSEPFNTIQPNLNPKYQLLTPQSNFYPSSGRVEAESHKKQYDSYLPSRKNSMSNLTSGINKIGVQAKEFQKESIKETVSRISSSKQKLRQILQTNYIKIEDKKKSDLDRIHLKIRQSRPELGNKPTQQLLDIILKTKFQKSQVKSNNNSVVQYQRKIRYLQQSNQQKNIQVKNVREQLDSMVKIMDSNKELLDRLREQIKLKTETSERTQKQLLETRQTVKKLNEENNQNVMKLGQIGTKMQRLQDILSQYQQKQQNLVQLKIKLQQANRIIEEKSQKQIELQKIVKQCQQVSNKCVQETLKGLEMEKNNLVQISSSLTIKNEEYERRNKNLLQRQRKLAEKESELQQLIFRMQKSEQCLAHHVGELQKTMDNTLDQTQKGGKQSYFENNFFECERDYVEIKKQLSQFEEYIKQKGKDNIKEQQVIQLNKKMQSLMHQYQLRIQQMERKLNLAHPKKQTI